MADFNDPVALSLQQRAQFGAQPQGLGGQAYLDAMQQVQPQQDQPSIQDLVSQAQSSAMAGGQPGGDSGTALYGYNPKTKELLVNGRILPADFSAWRTAASIPDDKLQPMARAHIFEAGFQPVDKDRLQALVQHIDDNAQSSHLGNIYQSLKGSTEDLVGGLVREGSRLPQIMENTPMGQAMAPIAQWVGDRVPAIKAIQDYNRGSQQGLADIGAGMSDAIAAQQQQDAADRRKGMTLEQQAYQDSTFGDHPVRATFNFATQTLPGMAEGVGAFMFNPVAGATVFGAQGAQQGSQGAQQSFDARTMNLSPDQMNASNPVYAQLRAQGMSDMQARDALSRHAADVGGDVSGALSALTAPLAGRIGMGALRQGSAMMPELSGMLADGSAKAWIARRLLMSGIIGGENTAIGAASTIPGQMAADVASGQGLDTPGHYAERGGLGQQFAVGALLGGFTPARVALQSDVGAAAAAQAGRAPATNDFAPAQGPAPRGMPELPNQGIRAPQQGMSQDMFGGATRPPSMPGQEPAAGGPAPVNPGQGEMFPVGPENAQRGPQMRPPMPGETPDLFGAQPRAAGQGEAPAAPQPQAAPQPGLFPDVGPQLPVPKAGLIKQRAAELAARQGAPAPEGPAGALPAPGPTEGQTGRVESAKQSLALVQNLLDSGQFNKRTKSGKATIEQLTQERDRLQAEVQSADNAVLGEQIGQARAERGAPEPASLTDSGQQSLPGMGQEPVVPAGQAPEGNTQPAPIGQNAPMSPEEAASRLQQQRARNPENQAPQADLFPKQLKQELVKRVAQDKAAQASDRGVSPSTPEPKADLAAQMGALQDGSRDVVFVAAGNEAQAPKVKGKVVQTVARPEGTLYTTNKAKAKAYREAPRVDDAMLAQLQDLPQSKAAALRAGDDTVTQALDKNGAVVKEALGAGNAPAVAEAAPKGGAVRQVSAARAQARRDVLNKAEQVKNAAAERAASAAVKKKSPAPEPVTHEEVTAERAAAPESVKKAEAALREDVTANHPQFADDVAEKPENTGAGRKAESPLTAVPLTREEMGKFADRAHTTAQAETLMMDKGSWSPNKSVTARILDLMGLEARSPKELRDAVRALAEAPREEVGRLMEAMGHRIADTTLAKGIVRGMDNVRAAVHENGYGGDSLGDGGNLHLRLMDVPAGKPAKAQPQVNEAASTDRVKLYGAMPKGVADVVHSWLGTVEKSAKGALPDQIHIMTPAEANARYGVNVPEHVSGATAEVRNPVTGKPERVVLLNWTGEAHQGAAMETLAHEMGHVITDHIYDTLPKEDRAAVDSAFKDWLQASGRMSPKEQVMSRLPPALRKLAEQADYNPSRAYASEWREWVADETAKWLLTSQEPKSAVDKFFAKIAGVLKSLYANIPGGGKPVDAVQRMMDNFVDRNRAVRENAMTARANAMEYGREPAEAPRPAEVTRAKIAMKDSQRMAGYAAQEVGGHLKQVLNGDTEGVKRGVNKLVTDLSKGRAQDVARAVKFAVSSMDDMVRSYGKRGDFGKGLVDWDHAKRLAEKEGREAQQPGQLALERAQRLSTPARKALEQVMYKATVYGVHPDEAFGVGKNKHLLDEDPAVEDSNRRRYEEVKRLYDNLKSVQGNPQKVYADLRDSLSELREKSFEAKRNNIESLPVSEAAKEEAHAAVDAQEARTLEGPYFPLVREGSYITTATMPAKPLGQFDSRAEAVAAGRREKAVNPHAEVFPPTDNGDGTWSAHAGEKAVYFHPTEKDALNARSSIEQEMKEAWAHRQVDMDAAEKEMGPLISDPYTATDFFRKAEVPQLGRFMTEVNKMNDAGQLDPEAFRRLSEMAIEALPESSPRKSNLQRQNIRGASEQMLTGYARHMLGQGHAYGQLVHGPEITRAWAAMEKNRRSSPEFGDVMNDLQSRQQILAKRMSHEPLNKFASTVQDISSFISLGMSPAFAVQQALQPVILSAPVLAARLGKDGKAVGYGKTMDALKSAYEGAVPFFGKRGMQQFAAEMKRALGTYGGDGKTLQESAHDLLNKFGKTDDERDMLKYLNDRGTLDFSFLNAVNDASTLSAAGSKAKAIMRLSMAFPQQIEAMNRTVTGLAAYRLAKEARGMDHADAVREANAVVSQTHGDYSRYNRPSAFNRPLVGMALQFKMYTQFMYSLFAHNIATAMNKNASREDRAQAVRTLGYVIGSHGVFGGTIGLGPVAGAAKFALGALMYGASAAGVIDKKKRDQTMEDWIRSEATSLGDELLGKGNGRELVKIGEYGAPSLVGIDLANKIGIPDLTDTRFTGKPLGEKAQAGDWMDRAMLTALGPVYSNAKRLANGTQALANGDVAQAGKQLMPAAPRALLSALLEQHNGIVTSGGQVIRDSKDISPVETFLRALGLQNPETGMAYDERAARYAAKDRIQTERDALLQKYQQARGADRVDLMKQISAFNQGRDKVFQITPTTLQHQLMRAPMSKTDIAAQKAVE